MMASEEVKLFTTSRDKSGGVFVAQHESQAEIIETHQKKDLFVMKNIKKCITDPSSDVPHTNVVV